MSTPISGKSFLFSDHLPSTKWLDGLPNGYLTNELNLECYDVRINKDSNGYHIYVGPVDPYLGGSAISVYLDQGLMLVEFETELLEPAPK